MEFPWNPNPKCTEKPQSCIPTHLFYDVFKDYIYKTFGTADDLRKKVVHNVN